MGAAEFGASQGGFDNYCRPKTHHPVPRCVGVIQLATRLRNELHKKGIPIKERSSSEKRYGASSALQSSTMLYSSKVFMRFRMTEGSRNALAKSSAACS